MTAYEQWSLIIGAVGVGINLILFAFFVLQLRVLRQQVDQARKATELDHQRRKAQATIEFYATTLEKRSQLRATLPYDRDADAIRILLERANDETNEVEKPVMEYLGLFELLATGVNTDVFDLATMERIAGGGIRAMAANYKPWIDHRRRKFDSPLLYVELEELAAVLEKRRAARIESVQARNNHR
ncbi:MAG: DUF4760 domain-containing protein [Egibacteraceae bacterium]